MALTETFVETYIRGFDNSGILLNLVTCVIYNWTHSFHQFGDAVRTVVEDREKLINFICILHHELGVVEIAQLEDRL